MIPLFAVLLGVGHAASKAQVTLPDGSTVRIVRLMTWDEKHGYKAWDPQGLPLAGDSIADVKTMKEVNDYWSPDPRRLHHRSPGTRWLGTVLDFDEKGPDSQQPANLELNLIHGKVLEALLQQLPGSPQPHVPRLVTDVFQVPVGWKRADGRIVARLGAFRPYSEMPIDGSKCEVIRVPPASLRIEPMPKNLTWVRHPAYPNDSDWQWMTRAKWSNGKVTTNAIGGGLLKDWFVAGVPTERGAHIVSVQFLRRHQFRAVIRNLPMFPEGSK